MKTQSSQISLSTTAKASTIQSSTALPSKARRLTSSVLTPEWILLFSLLALLVAGYSEAATVHSCQEGPRAGEEQCVIKAEDGIVGDKVKILDDKARPIASGVIVKRRGVFAVVKVSKSTQSIRRGYPVMIAIDSKSSSLQWAASFSDGK